MADVRNREENLKLAIGAFEEGLKVYTKDRFPQDYAMTQNNLGIAYRKFSDDRALEDNLNLAIRAYEEALKIYTEKDYPDRHKLVTKNLNRAKKGLQASK